MRILVLLLLILVIVGCGGQAPVNTGIHVPPVDHSQYSDSFYIKGWASLKAGNPAEAIKFFQQSNSVDEKIFVGFGYAYMAQNKLNFARQNFERALAANPDNFQAQLGMATLYEELNEKNKAFIIYSKLRAVRPEHAWVKVRYENIKSSETQLYLEKARELNQAGKRQEYIKALEKAAHYSPEIIDIDIEIADYHYTEEDYQKAALHYEKILEKQPNREDILEKLANSYENNNQFDTAVVIYKKLLGLKPGDINYINKINDLKIKFYDLNLPAKFKNIFFKQEINREELAALIGYYFEKQLEVRTPVIITDIIGSFARDYIIKVCSLGLMKVRADHSFDRFSIIDRARYAVVLNQLLEYLGKEAGYEIQLAPLEEVTEPRDISPLHKNYKIIKFLVNSQLIKLDAEQNFNPTVKVTPAEVLLSIRKILNSIDTQ